MIMSETNIENLAQQLGDLNVMQLIALTKKLEGDWGVSATPQTVASTQTNTQQESKVEQTEFTVSLVSYPADKKITLVKLVREVLSLGLLESKTLVETVPKVLKEGVSKDEAEMLRTKLTEAGGVVEVK
jgi:large subunit ribosomal protein L7/L12